LLGALSIRCVGRGAPARARELMARIRTLKPELPTDRKLAQLSIEARYTFVLCITQADDDGLLRAEPREALASLYPHDRKITSETLEVWIGELVAGGVLRERRTVDGARVIEVCNWKKHQKIDHPAKSRIGPLAKDSRAPRENGASVSRLDLGPRTLDLGPGTKDQLHDGAARRAEAAGHDNGGEPTLGNLMGLVRQHLYGPDGKPPADWDEARDGSILKQLRKGYSPRDIGIAIEGLALVRDHPGVFADEVDWLKGGSKVTLRALYNTSSGVLPMFSIATQAYWKHANSRPGRKDKNLPVAIGDLLQRTTRGATS
jgi:hypothetical protein